MTKASKKHANLLEKVKAMDWSDDQAASLDNLFEGVVALLNEEIDYYDDRRSTQRRISVACRWFVFFFGTAGAVAPLLQSFLAESTLNWTIMGYMALVLSGGIFTLNKVLGGTTGHSRYAMTQLKLEKHVSVSMTRWSQFQHKLAQKGGNTVGNRAVMLTFLEKTVAAAFTIILEETEEWSQNVQDALDNLEKQQKDTMGKRTESS